MTEPHAVHLMLPAPAPAPIGGYKVAYEYANALAGLGFAVTVWHSEAVHAFRGGRMSRTRIVKSWLAWWLRGRRRDWIDHGVSWFAFDPRVDVRTTGGLPRPRARRGDAVLATSVETTPLTARIGSRTGATTAVLVQHHETWADTPAAIAAGWASVDERIVIAPWLAEEVARAGLDSHLLTNALNTDAFPSGPPLQERGPIILSLLSPHGYKRPDVVAGVLHEVLRRRPGMSAVTFGQQSRPPVKLEGIRYVSDPTPDELRKLYRSARVYFCGSDAEGWHLPPAEATLSGAAVVSSDIGGVRASLETDAWYAPPGDVDALADAVERSLDELEESQSRVDRAAARLRSTTYADNARKLLVILDIAHRGEPR